MYREPREDPEEDPGEDPEEDPGEHAQGAHVLPPHLLPFMDTLFGLQLAKHLERSANMYGLFFLFYQHYTTQA